MGKSEPPLSRSQLDPSLYFIGHDSHGNWVVQDQSGLRGGLFTDRAKALKFALLENGHRPDSIVMLPGVFELDMGPKPKPARASTLRLVVSRPYSEAVSGNIK
jgi:hypothetical protein